MTTATRPPTLDQTHALSADKTDVRGFLRLARTKDAHDPDRLRLVAACTQMMHAHPKVPWQEVVGDDLWRFYVQHKTKAQRFTEREQ